MIRAFLLLGSNEGDRIALLANARSRIASLGGTIVKKSSIYQTAAWGKTEQAPFLNQVIEIKTALGPMELLKTLQSIEQTIGRVRKEKWGPRTIDIDILLYDNLATSTPELNIPHPGIPHRRFTLAPLAEVAGDLIHPLSKKSINELLEACDDTLTVEKISA